MKTLILFNQTYRLTDNPLLETAANYDDEYVFLSIIDSNWGNSINGFRKRSKLYEWFRTQCILEFRANLLHQLGIQLDIINADIYKSLVQVVQANNINKIMTEHPLATEEQAPLEKIQNIFPHIVIQHVWSNTLLYPGELGFDHQQLPNIFTDFRKQVEKSGLWPSKAKRHYEVKNKSKLIIPSILEKNRIQKDSSAVQSIAIPGEKAALDRLQYYVWEDQHIKTYKETRNQLLGQNFSSKFSPYLAHGVLSARTIYLEIKRYEEQVAANQSTYWLVFELLWRDYFRLLLEKYQNKLFKRGGIQNRPYHYVEDQKSFTDWCSGKTSSAFVNANMIELNETGYMSNRGRQNVASFLAHQLKQDWRKGASYFESKLLDYDVASNWGNWAYLAGVGTDPRHRIFNVEKQAERYDPDGAYIKHWLGSIQKQSPDS